MDSLEVFATMPYLTVLFAHLFTYSLLSSVSAAQQEALSRGSDARLSAEQCYALGFVKSDLSCNRCHELVGFDLESIKSDCLRCCNRETTIPVTKKFTQAHLEVCTCNLANFPQIEAFINSDRRKLFPNLSIKHVRGTLPVIKLLDRNSRVIEELRVEKWSTDTLEEFLRTRLS